MNITRRNHYLPQFYLNAFTNRSKGFWVYYKDGKEPILQTPINTGIERDLYSIKRTDGTIDDTLEKELFGEIESKASPIIRELIEPQRDLRVDDIQNIALFLATLATRVPRTINSANEMMEHMGMFMLQRLYENQNEIPDMLNELKKNGEIPEDTSTQKIINSLENFEKRYKVQVKKEKSLSLSLLITIEILNEILSMNWCLCNAPEGKYFITGDCPLVAFVPQKNRTAIFGAGYGLPDVEVTLPISPIKCIMLDRKSSSLNGNMNKEYVKEINKRIAWASNQFFISHINFKYLKKLINWARTSKDVPIWDKEELYKMFKSKIN